MERISRQQLFANKLRALRGVLSQRQFAFKSRVIDRTTLVRYEGGYGNPTMHQLWDLADYFNVRIDELIGRDYEQGEHMQQLRSAHILGEDAKGEEHSDEHGSSEAGEHGPERDSG